MADQNPTSKIDRFSWFVTHHRAWVLVLTLLVTLVFAGGIFRIQGKVLLEDLLPYDHPFLQIIDEFSTVFGTGGSWAGIVIWTRNGDIFNAETLKKIQEIDNEVSGWHETYRALTYSIGSRSAQVAKVTGTGEITYTSLMYPTIPKEAAEIAQLRYDIFSDSGIREIISEGGDGVLIQTEFKGDVGYQRAFALLNELADRYTDEQTRVEIVGFPVLMGWIYSYGPQIIFVMAVSTGFIVLIIFLIFRNISAMAAPVLFGMISTAMGLGFIGWTGINFSPLLYVLAFLVGARMISHAVQVTHRYMEELELAETGDKQTACYETIRRMIMPNWAGVATDGAGFLILILVKIALMQQVAIFMSFWMFTVALCGPLTPVLCSFMPLGKASDEYHKGRRKMSLMDRICTGSARFSVTGGRYVVMAVCAVALIFCAVHTGKLKIGDPSPGTSLLFMDHPFNQAVLKANQAFGASSDDLVVYFKGNKPEAVYDPAVLKTFAALDRHMQNTLSDIYKTSDSFIGIMNGMNVVMRDGDVLYKELPYYEDNVGLLFGEARSNLQVSTLRLYFDREQRMTQMTVYFTDHTSDNLLRIRDELQAFFKTHPMKIDAGEFLLAGGAVGMELATNEEMKRTHATIDMMVLGTILVLCALFYRSIVAGLMLTAPLILGNLVAFAYMSLNGIGLSINTLPVAAVGVGVGVDFAIYIYNRCREEFAETEIPDLSERWMTVI
ncbi:MAG: MMPL family transporter, partial [Deltaproteobacteria bacterium]|nr:MMPL family transporter [Deltaproteobacteria bacterium]